MSTSISRPRFQQGGDTLSRKLWCVWLLSVVFFRSWPTAMDKTNTHTHADQLFDYGHHSR